MRKNSYKQKNLTKVITILISCCFIILAISNLCNNVVIAHEESNISLGGESNSLRMPYASQVYFGDFVPDNQSFVDMASTYNERLVTEDEEFKYLSDLDYITTDKWSYVGWGSIKKDMPPEGSTITLKVDGKNKIFLKGMGFHAKAQLTYDISELSGKYTRFVSKAGIDASRGTTSTSGVWFRISVSNDGSTWTNLINKSTILYGNSEAYDIDVPISGYKYLRIYADPNGNNTADHAVLGGAKFVKDDYVAKEETYDKIHTLEYYDEILESKDINTIIGENQEIIGTDNYRLILEREFVRKLGYDAIVGLANLTQKTRDTLDWLLSSNDNLEQVIEVGEISGGVRFINVLADLYSTYKEDLTKTDAQIYKKMMIGLTAAYTSDTITSPLRFSNSAATYDYIERYEIIRDMYDEGLFLYGKYFNTYHIEFFRDIMQVAGRNDELRWLNYIGRAKNYNTSVYAYMAYISPNYNKPKLWAEENRQKYDAKWHLTENGVPYGDAIQRYWMVQEEGGICWNMSRNFAAISRMMGRPAIGCFQPSHEAVFFYNQNDDGVGSWGIANNIFGWGKTSTTWGGGNRARTIFNWANKSFTDQAVSGPKAGTSSGYVYLAQANLNRYADYKKSLYINLLANSYSDDNDKITVYNKALEACEINLDSYDYKIKSYKSSNKASEEWHELALDIIANYTFHPTAMNDLLKVIRPYLNSADLIDIDQREYTALNTAKAATNNDIWMSGACRELATAILGKMNRELATFSFDGDDANKIILSSEYDGRDIAWHYSIDGGAHLSEQLQEHSVTLSPEEVANINVENDIKIYIVGISTQKPIYTIDIKESTGIPSVVYANDLENSFIAAVPAMQWKMRQEDEWTSFGNTLPDLTGDKTIIVRMGPTGVCIAGEEKEYTFTQDNQPDTRKYIPVSHLSIHAYSTQSADSGRPFYAPNAIDGNINTIWHTDFRENVLQQPIKPFITIKLDEPKNISGLEFIQKEYKNNDPDNIKNARAYVSLDGESWIEAGKIENCNTYGELYALSFNDSVYGQYVKLEMDTTNMFASLAMVNLYEDTTKVTLATFSFNGANAGSIVMIDEYKGKQWEYSLDAGANWKTGSGDVHQLKQEEIEQINENDNIKIRLKGENKETIIYITKQEAPTISAYLNDLENRLIGITNIDNLEWKTQGDTKWTSYAEEEPIVIGNTKLFIRKKATGRLIASDAVEFQFTEDNQPDTSKYVPIKHLSIHAVSSTTAGRGEPGTNAIDGRPDTMWHSSRITTTMNDPRWITIKLDEPRYISKLQYVKKTGYTYGILKDGTISTSMDGENWETVAVINNLYNPTNTAELIESDDVKDIAFTEAKKALYIKIDLTKSCDYVNGSRDGVPFEYFFSAAMINLFEDITKREVPTAEIEYSTQELTNQDVTVTLVNPSREITITNNGGSNTYTFTENGTFTFEFIDGEGIKGTATANVTWIDKTMPTPTINYSTTNPTNGNVTATVTFDKENVTVEGGDTYTFTENGTHEFKFIGPAGNTGSVTANVTWIDRVVPVGTITYSSTNPSNKDVTATITFNKENVTVEGGNTHTFTENGQFTFHFVDVAGNQGQMIANVTWIDKDLPNATITYDIDQNTWTNEDVTATVTFDKENVTVEGGNTHTFTENGRYEFRFVGPAGNAGIAVAEVTWIDKVAPVATIHYTQTELTNKDVTATVTFNEENVTITNNQGNNTYTFTENGRFTFEFVDKAGNTGTQTAQVVWIDKTVPVPTITYNINDITNQDVIATVTFDKENVIIVDENGQEIENGNTYVFIENGTHEFKFRGPAGNTGTAIAEVTWIDKIPPVATVHYDITQPTKNQVTARVTFDEGGVTIVDENGLEIENGDTHIFTENGTYIFRYRGPLGNIGTAVAKVDWIDKTAPTAQISYSTTNKTNQAVTATLVNPSEPITITNCNSKEYTFTENGTFTFEFEDKVGNKGTAVAKVDWIDKVAPTAEIRYSTTETTNGNVTVTLVNPSEEIIITNNGGKSEYTFTENGEFTFEFVDKAGNKGTVNAIVLWIKKDQDKPSEYEIGDVNGDGKITATDLLLVKRHLVAGEKQEWILANDAFKFGDINEDGKITATDLLLIKRLVLKQMEIIK